MTTQKEFDSRAIIASSNFGPVRKEITVAAGADLQKGTLMARKSDGKFEPYSSGKTAVAVLLEDVPAKSEDAQVIAGFAGVYVKANIIGLDDTAEAALEERSIYFR